MFHFIHILILLSLANCTNGNVKKMNSTEIVKVDDTIKIHKIVENGTFKQLKLVKTIQSKVISPKDTLSVYEPAINSPKSVIFSKDGSKFYVNSLEGCVTIVFDSKSLKKLKEICKSRKLKGTL